MLLLLNVSILLLDDSGHLHSNLCLVRVEVVSFRFLSNTINVHFPMSTNMSTQLTPVTDNTLEGTGYVRGCQVLVSTSIFF